MRSRCWPSAGLPGTCHLDPANSLALRLGQRHGEHPLVKRRRHAVLVDCAGDLDLVVEPADAARPAPQETDALLLLALPRHDQPPARERDLNVAFANPR